MRRYLPLFVLVLAGPVAADDKKAALTPIPTAKLDRKEPVSYEKDIAPLFEAKCTVCHSGSLTEGEFDLGTYAGLKKGGEKGPAVVPGKAEESRLWQLVSHRAKPIMPPKLEDNPLTPEEVALVKLWIDQGAKGPAVDVRPKAKVVVGLPPALVNPVRAVAVSPDKAVVAAGRGNRVHLFDAKKGEFLRTLADPTLKTADGKPAHAAHLSLVESIAFSPDGKTLATGSYQEVTFWDVAKGSVVRRVTGFADRVVTLDYAPDGKRLATGGGVPTEDGEIKIIDAATGQVVADIKNGHSDTVFGVAFSPDGKLLATAAADKFVKVFEVPSGKQAKSFEGHTHHVLDVDWTPDGKRLVSAGADNLVKIWDYEKGEKVRDIRGHDKQVTRLTVFGSKPEFLTACGDSIVRLWNAENGGRVRQYDGSKDFVYAVAASTDGSVVAAGGEEGVVRLYNGQNGQLVKAMLPPGEKLEKNETGEPKKK